MFKKIASILLSCAVVFCIIPQNIVLASEPEVREVSISVDAKSYNAGTSVKSSEIENYLVSSILSCSKEIDLTRFGDKFTFKLDVDLNDPSANALIGERINSLFPELNLQAYADKYVDLYNVDSWNYKMTIQGNLFTIQKLVVNYFFDAAGFRTRNTAYKAVAEAMVADLKTNSLTEEQKVLILHDRLAAHCEYDAENYDKYMEDNNYEIPADSYNMYGALVKRVAVCQGYAKAYMYMLDLLGIPNQICSSEGMEHMWNIVTVDGKKYHVDVTRDDPYDINGSVVHSNLLVSTDEYIDNNYDAVEDFDLSPTDTHYDDYYWERSQTAFQYVDGEIYYINNVASDLMKLQNGEDECVVDISGFMDYEIKLCSYKNFLYYLYDDKVYEVDLYADSIQPQVVWIPQPPKNYSVYGISVEGNELVAQCFSGSNECLISYKIEPEVDITEALKVALNGVRSATYDGTAKKQSVSVVYGGKILTENKEYKVTYKANVNAGTATVILTGQNGYVGTASAKFTISPLSISSAFVTKISDKEYTGKTIKPSFGVTVKGRNLVYGSDYTVSYYSNVSTGKARIVIKGKGNYKGSITKYFYIHPGKVTGVKFYSATSKYIKLKWNKAPSGTGYAVRRKTSKNGSFKTIAILNSLKTTSYTDKNVAANKTYYYDVVAFKTVSGKKYASVASKTIVCKTGPATPKITYYKNSASKKAQIKWKKVSGAKGYKLYVSTKKGSGYKCIYTGSSLKYTKSGLKKGKTYYFKLKAYKKYDGKTIYSSFSSVRSVKISR